MNSGEKKPGKKLGETTGEGKRRERRDFLSRKFFGREREKVI